MNRRNFLRNGGLALSTAVLTPTSLGATQSTEKAGSILNSWLDVRNDFNLDYSYIQMAQMLLASHPSRVRTAIGSHRNNLEKNPATYWESKRIGLIQKVYKSASAYLEVHPDEIALTDSTTQGMSLLLNGFKIKPGEEILSTTHDHYITDMSIEYSCQKKGAISKKIAEYQDPYTVSVDEVVNNISKNIGPKTRLVVVTWVQSCTGVKLPIRAIADEIRRLNNNRNSEDRIYFLVDGVHGFGNQSEAVNDLGCDFFAAGTHKWIFGPRGTGILWGRKDAWDMVESTIPPFRMNPFLQWLKSPAAEEPTFSEKMSPGGFHSFEHRWALNEAFDFQMEIGREKVHERTTELNSILKNEIEQMKHVKLITPLDPTLSAGINCFMVEGRNEKEVVKYLHHKRIIASSSPYKVSYARLTPCIVNTEEEVAKCVEVLSEMKT